MTDIFFHFSKEKINCTFLKREIGGWVVGCGCFDLLFSGLMIIKQNIVLLRKKHTTYHIAIAIIIMAWGNLRSSIYHFISSSYVLDDKMMIDLILHLHYYHQQADDWEWVLVWWVPNASCRAHNSNHSLLSRVQTIFYFLIIIIVGWLCVIDDPLNWSFHFIRSIFWIALLCLDISSLFVHSIMMMMMMTAHHG